MNSRQAVLGVLGLAAMLASDALVRAQSAGRGSLEAQLERCAAVTEPGARLRCYDGLTRTETNAPATTQRAPGSPGHAAESTPAQPSAHGAAAAVPAAAAAPSASSAPPPATNAEFGVRNSALEAKRAPPREKRMLAVISSVSVRGHGELVLTLDNGQVWSQIEARDYPAKPGDHIEIDEGALGSYVLWSPANRRATKVTRIN